MMKNEMIIRLMDILKEVVNTVCVEKRSATLNTVNFITLFKKEVS